MYYDPDKYSDTPQTPAQEKVFEIVKKLQAKYGVVCNVHFVIPGNDSKMQAKLLRILHTLQYSLETFEETCDCKECDPCTKGQQDLKLAITEIQEVAEEVLGIKKLVADAP